MRLTKLVLTLSALLVMSGCTNTYHGARDNARDTMNWMHSEPSYMEKRWGAVPTGYYGQHKRAPLLKPRANVALVWREMDGTPVDQGAVTVYPVDGAPPQYTDNTGQVYADYGQLMQQLYFDHGSAAIGRADRDKLTELGHSAASQNTAAVTVIGHASTRVDGVADPIRRKEINFEMAQKRANAVMQVLRKAGVTPGWVEAVSKGEEEATGNESADRRADVFMR
jgi:outer membrane protein OmpA-like peptidoglycan-associated protein